MSANNSILSNTHIVKTEIGPFSGIYVDHRGIGGVNWQTVFYQYDFYTVDCKFCVNVIGESLKTKYLILLTLLICCGFY